MKRSCGEVVDVVVAASRCRLLVLLLGALAACATSQQHPVVAPATSEGSERVVTAVELVRGAQGEESLLNALQRVRPLFLRERRSVPLVSIDGSPAVDRSVLATIPVSEVAEVRMLRASSSVSRVGITPDGRAVLGDVILVHLRTHRMSLRD